MMKVPTSHEEFISYRITCSKLTEEFKSVSNSDLQNFINSILMSPVDNNNTLQYLN
ncbi:CRPV-014 [Crowpox virus]|nr:CRPV-014 [Crowpox virus]